MAIAIGGEVTREFLDAFGEAWNRHDVDAIMAAMADDCAFEVLGCDLFTFGHGKIALKSSYFKNRLG